MPTKPPRPEVHPASRAEWRAWLAAHHDSADGVWLVCNKRSTGQQEMSYEDSVEEALCFGWIDSTTKSLDTERTKMLFTPRKPGSAWAQSNKVRVSRLTRAGLMTGAGLRAVELAKRNGSWTALDEIDALVVPGDLAAAFATEPAARANFDGFTATAKKAALWWIASAKRPETRARRVAETVRLAAEGRTVS